MSEQVFMGILIGVAVVWTVGPTVLHFFLSGESTRHRHHQYERSAHTITERIQHEAWDDTRPVYREDTVRVKDAEYKPDAPTAPTRVSPVERVKNMGGR